MVVSCVQCDDSFNHVNLKILVTQVTFLQKYKYFSSIHKIHKVVFKRNPRNTSQRITDAGMTFD